MTYNYLELMSYLNSLKKEDGIIYDLVFTHNKVVDIPPSVQVFNYIEIEQGFVTVNGFFGFTLENSAVTHCEFHAQKHV